MCLTLSGIIPTGRAISLHRFQRLQTVRNFERTCDSLRPLVVHVNGSLGAVLTHQVHGDVNVIVPVLRDTVTHGNPTAWCLGSLVIVETHLTHKVVGDRIPLFIGKRALFGAQ